MSDPDGRKPEAHPVLLLHGFTGSVEAWGKPILDGLSARGPLVAVDLPGHGCNAAPSDLDACRIERVVDELGAVLDRKGVERADWVGYSMGGRIALAAAVLRPERVRRLVLESASPGIADEKERDARKGEDEALARKIEELGIEWFVAHWMNLPLFATQARLPAGVRRGARERRLQNRPEALAMVLRGMGAGSQPSFWGRLSELRHQTLVLTGSEDETYQDIGKRIARALPLGVHRSVPGTGHTVHLEAPDQWLREAIPFLDEG